MVEQAEECMNSASSDRWLYVNLVPYHSTVNMVYV